MISAAVRTHALNGRAVLVQYLNGNIKRFFADDGAVGIEHLVIYLRDIFANTLCGSVIKHGRVKSLRGKREGRDRERLLFAVGVQLIVSVIHAESEHIIAGVDDIALDVNVIFCRGVSYVHNVAGNNVVGNYAVYGYLIVGLIYILIISDLIIFELNGQYHRRDLISHFCLCGSVIARCAVILINNGINAHVAQRGGNVFRALAHIIGDVRGDFVIQRSAVGAGYRVRQIGNNGAVILLFHSLAFGRDGYLHLRYHENAAQGSGSALIVRQFGQRDRHGVSARVDGSVRRAVISESERFTQDRLHFALQGVRNRDRDFGLVERHGIAAIFRGGLIAESQSRARFFDDEGRPFVALLVAHAEDIIVGGKSFGRCAGIISPRVERLCRLFPFGIGIGGEENVVHRVAIGAVDQLERLKVVVKIRLICVSQRRIVIKADISVALEDVEFRLTVIYRIVIHAVHRAGRGDRGDIHLRIVSARAEAAVGRIERIVRGKIISQFLCDGVARAQAVHHGVISAQCGSVEFAVSKV